MYVVFCNTSDKTGSIKAGVNYIVYDTESNIIEKIKGGNLKRMIKAVGTENFNNVLDFKVMPPYIYFYGIVLISNEFILISNAQLRAVWAYGTYAVLDGKSPCYISDINPLNIFPKKCNKQWGQCSYADFIRMYCV